MGPQSPNKPNLLGPSVSSTPAPKKAKKAAPKSFLKPPPKPKTTPLAPAHNAFAPANPLTTRATVTPEIEAQQERQAKYDAPFVTTNEKTKPLWTAPAKAPYVPPTDYPDMLGPKGSRTHLSPTQQAATLKVGVTKEQVGNFNKNAIAHPLVASILLADSGNPIPESLRKYTVKTLIALDPDTRKNVLAGVPDIQSRNILFTPQERQQITKFEKVGLPKNASDKQILDFFHNKTAEPKASWSNLEKPSTYINDLSDLVKTPAYLLESSPALIGAAADFEQGHPGPAAEVVKEAAAPYAHPLAFLQRHPVQAALTVTPLAEAAAGKAAETGLLGVRAAEMAETNVPRVVSLPKYDSDVEIGSKAGKPGRALTQGIKDEITSQVGPLQDHTLKKAGKKLKLQVANEGVHNVGQLIKAVKRSSKGISTSRQIELLNTEAQGLTNGELHDYYLHQSDQIQQGIEANKTLKETKAAVASGEAEKLPGSNELHNVADQLDDQAQSARVDAEMARERQASLPASKKTSSAKLDKTIAKHEARATEIQAQADGIREQANALGSTSAPTDRQIPKLLRVQRQVEAHANLADRGELPVNDHEQTFLDAHRDLANYRTGLLQGLNNLGDTSAMFREYQPAIQTQAAAGDPLAKTILDAREAIQPVEQAILKGKTVPEAEQTAYLLDKHIYESHLQDFADRHIESGAPEPFRVPKEQPRPLNPLRRPSQASSVPASLNVKANAGSLQYSTGAQFEHGSYVPPRSAHVVADALRAQKAANGVEFVQRVTDPAVGLVKVAPNGAKISDLVSDPENFVLRKTDNLRAAPKVATDASDQVNEAASQKDAEHLWDESHYSLTTVPETGNYVLVPKPLDDEVSGALAKPQTAKGWANKLFRYQVLYLNPKWAVGNLVGNVIQGTLERTGPLSYLRAARGDVPLAPGVEEHGFIGSHAGDLSPQGLTARLQDIKFEPSTTGKIIKVGKLPLGYLGDLVSKLAVDVENYSRAAVYSKTAVKEARGLVPAAHPFDRVLQGIRGITPDVHEALQAMADGKTPEARAAATRAVDHMNTVLNDYASMRQAAKVEAFVPFWKWFYFIGTLMLKTPFNFPKGYQLAMAAGRVGQQVNRNLGGDLLPFNQQGKFPIAGSPSNALTVNLNSSANPFSTAEDAISDPTGMAPLASLFFDAATGQDVSDARPLLNAQGQNFSPQNQGTTENPPSDNPAEDTARYVLGQILGQNPIVSALDQVLNGSNKADTSIPLFSDQNRQPTKADFAAAAPKSPFAKSNPSTGETALEKITNFLLPIHLARTNLSGTELKDAIRYGTDETAAEHQNVANKGRRKIFP